jgi:hypothetical protein
MNTLTTRIRTIALIAVVALSVLGLTLATEDAPGTEGDLAVGQAWTDVSASVGNALFAVAYAERAVSLGLDDGETAIERAKKDVTAAVGNVLFAYDFRACERARAARAPDSALALR